MSHHRNGYDSSGLRLYNLLVGEGTEESILDTFVEYTDHHRKYVLQFMELSITYLVMAMQVGGEHHNVD